MVDATDYKRRPPNYVVENVEDLQKDESKKLSIRQKAIPFEFPIDIQDKIDVALVMEKFKNQSFYASLSAPKLGIMKRVIVFTIPRSETKDSCRTKVFLNPSYEKVGDETTVDIECCVSVKGVVAPVPRYATIRYEAYDIKGGEVGGEATGVMARLIQHEVDHLDGKLFIDLVSADKLMSSRDYFLALHGKQNLNESSYKAGDWEI